MDDQVTLPAGTRLAWVGQYQNMERANARLKQVVPITLLLVVLVAWAIVSFGKLS